DPSGGDSLAIRRPTTGEDLGQGVGADLTLHAVRPLRAERDLPLTAADIAVPESITFPSAGGRTAHALLYRPASATSVGPADERPPLVVMIHGGPTAAARPMFSLSTQLWTSRGFAVVDVDYGGSTGYGRPYRRLLDDAWGVVDVEDCIAAARFLAESGVVDGDRVVIRGGSAGGLTTLAALCTSDVFAAGTSLYGVTDLGALARDTHKFESRYLDGLVGPWPEAEATYAARSPMNLLDGLTTPVLVLQGADDMVVPPSQAEAVVAAVAAKGLPHAYLLFAGEGHGFRQGSTIVRALQAELAFYGQVLGFTPADDLPPLPATAAV
ncbi:MAG TPA: prolyl oligopeptidase family serine peptidase, partial [Iamia sp.]|nr:prolyl oligopeptidase family serine peptidase [Iamia sp.]